MKRTEFVADERFMDHVTGPYHPESPERLKSVLPAPGTNWQNRD